MLDSRTLQPGLPVGGGRFTLTRALGRGGMGVVWLGQDTRLGEEVALKFLPPEVAADAVALNDLRRETARSHKLTHLHIIRIHDFHEPSDGMAFISMEYVDGPTLSAWRLQQPNQVLSWAQLAPLTQQLCAALDYAHGENVIHRDLKPANVMLDGKGRVKLADFGIAAVVSDSASRVSMLGTSGTLAYMSPQQLTGERPTATDDIYALGATLYELLSGRPPFYTGDITHQVLHKSPEALEERLAGLGIENPVPPEVAAMIMACLAKDPAQRPQSAAAVAEWIGLATEKTPSIQNAARAVSDSSAGLGSWEEAERVDSVAGSAAWAKRVGLPVVIVSVVLLMGGGTWWFIKKRGTGKLPTPAGAGSVVATTGEEVLTLFDGTSTASWKGANQDSFPDRAWEVENGVLKTRAVAGNDPAKQNLVTRESFQDFELDFDWRISPGGNSGVFYGAREFQLVDDAGHPNGKVPETSCGSFCYVLAPSGGKPSLPAGQFHRGKLVVNGSHVEHWLNDQKILEYDFGTDEFKTKVQAAKNKYAYLGSVAEICRAGEIPIILQNHTGIASFRNVRLRRLSAPRSPGPETGFVSLFNGRDLSGWEGDLAVWSVKDGVINARATTREKIYNYFLTRKDLVAGDFELRLSCKLIGDTAVSESAGNIGIRYRCYMDATPVVTGYQMDLAVNKEANGKIYEGMPRGFLAMTGQKVLAQAGGAKGTLSVVGSVSTPDEIDAVFKRSDWNELTIIAEGNHLIHKINGLVAAELTDEDPAHRSLSGQLALKLWFNKGPVAAAQIKDIRLKRLAPKPVGSGSAANPVPEVKEFVYKQTPQGPLKLWVHFPPDWKSSDQNPAMAFFFGGSWKFGSPTQFLAQAEYFASRGLVTARADYRVLSRQKTTPDKSVEDAKSSIRWLRSHAKELGLDPARVVASGFSAGGHLAVATALFRGFNDPADDLGVSCQPNALVLFSPVLNNYAALKPKDLKDSNGREMRDEFWPTPSLNQQAPPTIIFYGTSDPFLAQGREYHAKAKSLGLRIEFLTAANQPHGLFNQAPWKELSLSEADRFLASLGYLKGLPTMELAADGMARLQRE